jgi:hypothetical protein
MEMNGGKSEGVFKIYVMGDHEAAYIFWMKSYYRFGESVYCEITQGCIKKESTK